jgi:hypothetical protein
VKQQHGHQITKVSVADESEIAGDRYAAQTAHRAHAECARNEAGGEIADRIDHAHARKNPS